MAIFNRNLITAVVFKLMDYFVMNGIVRGCIYWRYASGLGVSGSLYYYCISKKFLLFLSHIFASVWPNYYLVSPFRTQFKVLTMSQMNCLLSTVINHAEQCKNLYCNISVLTLCQYTVTDHCPKKFWIPWNASNHKPSINLYSG